MTGAGREARTASTAGPLDVPPTEDSGADTQDRFHWQHHCTAADAIRMLIESDIQRIVCEVHEDYAIEGAAGFELVSCKHREASRGPWGLRDLCAGGGIAHLFGRWEELGEVRAKLLTNAGLAPGENEAADVIDACVKLQQGADPSTVSSARDALARALLAAGRTKEFTGIPKTEAPKKRSEELAIPSRFCDRVTHFMRVLSIKSELPARNIIETVHAHDVMRPALERLGYSGLDPLEAYRAVVAAVSVRNRVHGLTGRYAHWFWGEEAEGQRGTLAALVAARSIYARDVLHICRTCDPTPVALFRPHASDHARLNAKLVAGNVGPIRRREAARLREAWLAEWSETRTGLPGDAASLYDLETRILGVAGDAEAAARHGSDPAWGDRLFGELKARLQDGSVPKSIAAGELLLGAAFDLAARCHIWFSEEFDVEAVLREAAEGGGS